MCVHLCIYACVYVAMDVHMVGSVRVCVCVSAGAYAYDNEYVCESDCVCISMHFAR